MSQYVSPYETLYVLTLERRLNNCGLEQNVVRKDEPNKVFKAGNVSGRRSIDVGDANRVQTKLSCQALADYATRCASVYHSYGHCGRRDRGARCPKSSLDGRSNGNPEIDNRSDTLKVRNLRGEGWHNQIPSRFEMKSCGTSIFRICFTKNGTFPNC